MAASTNTDLVDDLTDVEHQIAAIAETLEKHRDVLPEQRPPVILICGKAGNGKSTTINTLFGSRVANVGHYSRGTSRDAVYEWESQSENVHIVDLPGLGDSPKHDRVFAEIYRERIKEADGFIVVVTPPRPAEEGTLKTVRLLLKHGVPGKNIVFGFNKLSWLHYEVDGVIHHVAIQGLRGVADPRHLSAVHDAKRAFLTELSEKIPRVQWSEQQVIEYDSITGWNLYRMLTAVVNNIPFQTAVRLKRAAEEAHRELKRREAKHLADERMRLEAEEERLKAEAKALRERENKERELKEQEAATAKLKEELQRQEQELNQHRQLLKQQERAVEALDSERDKFERTVFDRFLEGAELVVKIFRPDAAEEIRKVRNFVADVGRSVTKSASGLAKKATTGVKNFLKRFF